MTQKVQQLPLGSVIIPAARGTAAAQNPIAQNPIAQNRVAQNRVAQNQAHRSSSRLHAALSTDVAFNSMISTLFIAGDSPALSKPGV